MTEDTRVDKIQKLLAKAERAGTPEEAEAFAAKAQELMTKWAIDELMVRAAGDSTEEVVVETFTVATSHYQHDAALANACALANDVACAVQGYVRGRRPAIILVGFESDVRHTKMLYASLQIQLTRACRTADQPVWDRSSRPVFLRAFRLGYAAAVGHRLEESKAHIVREVAAYDGTLLPAIIEKKDAVRDAFNDAFGETKTTSMRMTHEAGFVHGHAAGQGADVGGARIGGANQAIGTGR